jgi:predicted transcriptional regulator
MQNFVPVVDDQKNFIGIITRKDIIRYFYEKSQEVQRLALKIQPTLESKL